MKPPWLAATIGVVVITAGLECFADTVVTPEERLPTLHCLHLFDAEAESPRALCEIVNDTSDAFIFDGADATTPNYSIERSQDARWTPAAMRQDSRRSGKFSIAAGAAIEFSARLPRVDEPVRVRLDVYRSAGTSPIAVFGNAFRLPRPAKEAPQDDIPVLLCHEILPPKLLHRVPPEYPDVAKHARIQGTVVLDVVVDRQGHVQDVRVVRSIPVLDPAAVSAVKQWTYKPSRDRLENIVAVHFPISVKFELPSEK